MLGRSIKDRTDRREFLVLFIVLHAQRIELTEGIVVKSIVTAEKNGHVELSIIVVLATMTRAVSVIRRRGAVFIRGGWRGFKGPIDRLGRFC